jgi:hypothetical protein
MRWQRTVWTLSTGYASSSSKTTLTWSVIIVKVFAEQLRAAMARSSRRPFSFYRMGDQTSKLAAQITGMSDTTTDYMAIFNPEPEPVQAPAPPPKAKPS